MRIFIFFFLLTISSSNQLWSQFKEDFERYNYLQRISPQSLNWITWSEDPLLGTGYITDEDGIISNTDYPNYGETQHYSSSGKQALFIGKSTLGSQPQDVVLDLHNKSIGRWNLSWKMYIPNKKKAYYNFQENTPITSSGNWAIQIYFNVNGKGKIKKDTGGNIINFTYPQDEWFEIRHNIDLDNDTISIEIVSNSGTSMIYNSSFLSNTQHLGGINFYSISNTNKFYIDDIVFEKSLPIENVYIWDNNRWEDINGNELSGEPDTSYEVILRESFNIGTSSSASTVLNCLNLVFENDASLQIPKGSNAVVSNNLIVPAANNIVVEDGGSFIMLNNLALIYMPDSDSFKQSRKSNVLANVSDYTYWSSPVNGIDISAFGSSYVYSYTTSNFMDLYSGTGYPQTTGTPDRYDDNGDDWFKESDVNGIVPAKGYAVLTPGNTTNHTVEFTGVPNNGFISVPVSLSANDLNTDDDWNLIGNPYPSAIDASILINSNINLSGTLYFWTHNTELGGAENDGPNNSNYNPNDYASFNLSGGISASTGGEIPNGYIASGQGFFMEVNSNGVITFNNDMRVINLIDENTQFYKSSVDKVNIGNNVNSITENRIWLNFTNDNGVFSQSLIAFLPAASDAYDSNYDGVRAGASLQSKFYSILEDKELAIQGRSELKEEEIIPLGFYISKPENFTISIDGIEGLIADNEMNIYLIDHELKISHNLKIADYHFNVAEKGANNTRFTLNLTSATLGVNMISKEINELTVINSNNDFNIVANQIVNNVKVYDLMGRILITDSPNAKRFCLKADKIENGTILIIQARMKNGNLIDKKVIKM